MDDKDSQDDDDSLEPTSIGLTAMAKERPCIQSQPLNNL